jgi:hypothetical protein
MDEVYNRKVAITSAIVGESELFEMELDGKVDSNLKNELNQMEKENKIWMAFEDMKDAENMLGTRFFRRVHPQDIYDFLETMCARQ